jgi:hypothetical protein
MSDDTLERAAQNMQQAERKLWDANCLPVDEARFHYALLDTIASQQDAIAALLKWAKEKDDE